MRAWFLPREEDVLGRLRRQAAGVGDLVLLLGEWSRGDCGLDDAVGRARVLLDTEAERRRELHTVVRAAFSTPLEAEDLYELAERLFELAEASYGLLRDAQVLGIDADPGLRPLLEPLGAVVERLDAAFALLPAGLAAEPADEAALLLSRQDSAYRAAVALLDQEPDIRRDVRRRELYRRAEHVVSRLARVAHRTWYAVVKVG